MHAAKIELVYLGVVGLLFLQSPILFSFGFDGLIMLDISRRIHVHSGLIRFHLSVFPERSQVALLISKPQKINSFFVSLPIKYCLDSAYLLGLRLLQKFLEDLFLGLKVRFQHLPLFFSVLLHHVRPLLCLVDDDALQRRIVHHVRVSENTIGQNEKSRSGSRSVFSTYFPFALTSLSIAAH